MKNRWKLILGIIFLIIGISIFSISFIIGRFIPGGLISLAIGIILISDSRNKTT